MMVPVGTNLWNTNWLGYEKAPQMAIEHPLMMIHHDEALPDATCMQHIYRKLENCAMDWGI